MPNSKIPYHRIQRELTQIKQTFWPKGKNTQPLSYIPKPLELLKPEITATASDIDDGNDVDICINYKYSHHEMLLIAIWNQCQILLKHKEKTSFSTEETSEFYANFNAFKAHPEAPDYEGTFAICDDYMYLIAVCWSRWLSGLSPKAIEGLNLITFHEKLKAEISRYTPRQHQANILLKNSVTQAEVVAELENRFKHIYTAHKIKMDNISDKQLAIYFTLRYLGYLVSLSMLAFGVGLFFFPLSAIISSGLACISVLSISLSVPLGITAHLCTRVNSTIPKDIVKENDMKYDELKTLIMKEFPTWRPKTTTELRKECEQPEERKFLRYLQ